MYLKDKKGKIRFWSIESTNDGFEISHGMMGGVVQSEFEPVPYGKASRSQQEQIASMVASRVKKRLEMGYKYSIEEAEKQVGRGANDLGLPRPMLAARFDCVDVDVREYYHQPKLDGHRCLISTKDDDVIAYSRNGKPISAIQEILEEVDDIFAGSGLILDGELYIHGVPLQQLSSRIKRRQDDTALLEYWIYDIVDSNAPFYIRWNELLQRMPTNTVRIKICPTIKGVSSASTALHAYKDRGFEGAILRSPESLYQAGIRSKGLIKVKSFLDDEFTVVNITASKDDWAILTCITSAGKTFNVSAPGNFTQKRWAYTNKDAFIGKTVRVEYANLTKDGIPFHPVATEWRNKHDE